MAFPSDQGNFAALEQLLSEARRIAGSLKATVQNYRARSQAGTLTGRDIIALMGRLTRDDARLGVIASAGGSALVNYAQGQYDDAGLDVSAEFTAMRAEIVGLRDWVVANIPTSAGGYFEIVSAVDGAPEERVFSAGQTSGFRAQADVLLATID